MAVISVIVPVYKVENYLARCVDSILAQRYQDFELILVDDGSPDNCGAICDYYAKLDDRIHVIHQENGGLSAARNAGIDWAFSGSESQYLAFVDSDDWVAPDYLQQLYQAVSGTGCRIAACGLYKTEGAPLPKGTGAPAKVMEAEDYYCSQVIHDGVTMVAWNKLYHRSLFEKLRYPVGKLHEDEFTTYLAVYEAGQVAVLLDPLYAYFQNAAGIMQAKWDPRRIHSLEAVAEQIAFARREDHPGLLKKAVEQYIFTSESQLRQAEQLPQYRQYYCRVLRGKLRWGLKMGEETGVFPKDQAHLWAWESAWPCKPYWWLYSKVRKL